MTSILLPAIKSKEKKPDFNKLKIEGNAIMWPFALCVLLRPRFLLFFFFFCAWTVTSRGFTVHALFSTVHVLKNIKNESHDTIYIFKNYFATVFSVFRFQFLVFSNNKLNPNGPREWTHSNVRKKLFRSFHNTCLLLLTHWKSESERNEKEE